MDNKVLAIASEHQENAAQEAAVLDDIKMTLLVNCLVKRTRELLHGVDQDLVSLAIHFEALGQCLALPLNHAFARKDHVVEDLVLENINFTSSLIILL